MGTGSWHPPQADPLQKESVPHGGLVASLVLLTMLLIMIMIMIAPNFDGELIEKGDCG
jgi:hypothetical protein